LTIQSPSSGKAVPISPARRRRRDASRRCPDLPGEAEETRRVAALADKGESVLGPIEDGGYGNIVGPELAMLDRLHLEAVAGASGSFDQSRDPRARLAEELGELAGARSL